MPWFQLPSPFGAAGQVPYSGSTSLPVPISQPPADPYYFPSVVDLYNPGAAPAPPAPPLMDHRKPPTPIPSFPPDTEPYRFPSIMDMYSGIGPGVPVSAPPPVMSEPIVGGDIPAPMIDNTGGYDSGLPMDQWLNQLQGNRARQGFWSRLFGQGQRNQISANLNQGAFGVPGPGGQQIPLASPPPSARYGGGIPSRDFIYTNPVAAQQASQSLASRLGYQQLQDQGYRDYLAKVEANRQAQLYQQQRFQENELDRQLQREGFASSERSAANRAYGYSDFDRRESARQKELAEMELKAKKANYEAAVALAATLNSPMTPRMKALESARQNPKLVMVDPTGKIVPSMPDPDLAAPGVATIGQLQGNVQANRQRIRDAATPVAPPVQ